jgi:hypothetical protein
LIFSAVAIRRNEEWKISNYLCFAANALLALTLVMNLQWIDLKLAHHSYW